MLQRWLSHPLTRGMDMDDPHNTWLRRQIIAKKPFLRLIYEEWYRFLAQSVPDGPGQILEIGSGAGFLEQAIPELIKSEIFFVPGTHLVSDAQQLPFADSSLKAVLMTNVLHHVPQPRRFFAEASRCVRPGGKLVMVEPWVSPWSRFFYHYLHYEPFEPGTPTWEFPSSGPVSGANDALPWVIFERDKPQFEREFPQWEIEPIKRFMPFRYMASGGISMRSLMPVWSFGLWTALENLLHPMNRQLAMFAQIVLRRREE